MDQNKGCTRNTSQSNTDREIEELLCAARDERADALNEIVTQHDEFASYFFGLLTMSVNGYPYTFRLVSLASIVATFTVLHFKAGVRGRRLCPGPALANLPGAPAATSSAGHPSYKRTFDGGAFDC